MVGIVSLFSEVFDGKVTYGSPLFSRVFSGWSMFTALLCNDFEWWGRCFLYFSKVFDGRLPLGFLGFPIAGHVFLFAFQ